MKIYIYIVHIYNLFEQSILLFSLPTKECTQQMSFASRLGSMSLWAVIRSFPEHHIF